MTYNPQSQDLERQRIQELLSFYSHVESPFDAPNTSGLKDQPASRWPGLHNVSTPDITLNALNQLGLYRFGCARSFTCLVLDEQRHIIAEAKTAVSSHRQERQTRDSGVSFGQDLRPGIYTPNIARSSSEERSNVVTIPNITTNGGRCIIRDTIQDDTIKDHPALLEWPHMRFYAEVPLYSPLGYTLGTYCIADESPRAVFDDTEIQVLEEIAGSIANHLENAWSQQRHNRAARMMNGLSEFVGGHNDTGANPGEPQSNDDEDAGGISDAVSGGSQTTVLPTVDNCPIATRGTASPSTWRPSAISFSQKALDTKTGSSSPFKPFDDIHLDRPRRGSTSVSVSDVSAIPHQLSTLFARASSLIRECLDIEGALFVDASRANVRRSSSVSFPAPEFDLGSLDDQPSPCPLKSSGFSSDGIWSNGAGKVCEILGFDLNEASVSSTSKSAFLLTDNLLYNLIHAFRYGEVFDIQAQGQQVENESEFLGASARRELVSHMTDHFPGAKSVLFLPLWDWTKSRWLAACVLWSKDSGCFSSKELNYLKAFCNSIISQIAQNDWATKEKAKSDFISSISHELRSPLHGVLASAELLQSTVLQPAQQDMIKMVETCGITLLDTMNYLLDFAKINNLTATGAKEKSSQPGGAPDLTATFDLDTLIEEVTNSLYAGHRFPRCVDQVTGSHPSERVKTPQGSDDELKSQDRLSVVTRVEDQDAWTVRSVSGAWRRIAMNLIGNALKFTRAGFVEITLSKSEISADPDHVLAHLSVTDTGRGISPDFLQNRIFAPFSQEDTLSEGVGLGLSIVQQLVTSLGGNVEVKSEVELGTQVDVYIPIERPAEKPWSDIPTLTDSQPRKVCLVGFDGYTELKKTPNGILSTEAKRKLAVRRSLSSIFLNQPGWMVSFSESLSNGSGDIAVVEEDKLRQVIVDDSGHLKFEHLIVLGDCGANSNGGETIKDEKVVHVTQPIGPRKVIEVLNRSRVSPAERHTKTPIPVKPIALPLQQQTTKHISDEASVSQPKEDSTPDIPVPLEDQMAHENPHVLIVDDNDINLKILETFMRKIGGSYDTATNGLIAVEKYQQSPRRFDYVLMDISMPVMDGIVASTKIREYEQEKTLQPSAIMAVTGVASATMQQKAFDAGINDYLVKPISLNELKRIMNIK